MITFLAFSLYIYMHKFMLRSTYVKISVSPYPRTVYKNYFKIRLEAPNKPLERE